VLYSVAGAAPSATTSRPRFGAFHILPNNHAIAFGGWLASSMIHALVSSALQVFRDRGMAGQ
jgi:hypothetical protein